MGPDRPLAYTLAAFILFVIANAYPIIGLEVQGDRQNASLYDAVHTLWAQGRPEVAVLVGFTTILTPALQIALLTYVLLPMKFNRVAAGMIKRGVMPEPDSREPWFMCAALSRQDIAETAMILEDALREALEKL